MIKLAHISPKAFFKEAEENSDINLVLAHLVGDNEYTKFYAKSSKYTIMDNSAFELGSAYAPEKLIELGKKIFANCMVLPDYPGEDWTVTRDAAIKHIDSFVDAGVDCMYVPQSKKGDFDGYMEGLNWALNNPKIKLIGISILGAPNALPLMDRNDARAYILSKVSTSSKKFHMLGKLDSVDEIKKWKAHEHKIFSHDTSAAVWYGMNGLSVQNRTKKFAVPVDFSESSRDNLELVLDNMNYMKGLV